ncbi:MAG: AAA family ATPase [Deltaproteobacteria bacterium]|nr:AAA family ATPase [Deltaproteobacteria bacterium]
MELVSDNSKGIITLPRIYKGADLKFISVTGGKGGVGKSSISVNLAIALGALGGRVLILDGDLGLANADQLLGINVSNTLYDVVRGNILLEEAIVTTKWNVDLLPTASGRREMVEMDEGMRVDLIETVRGLHDRYEYVVIDTAAGIGDTAMNLAAAGDIVLGVTTPDPTSVRDVFSVMKVLSKEFGVKNFELLSNKVKHRAEGKDLYRRISGVAGRFLPIHMGYAGFVLRDPSLAKSIIERTPLMASYPSSPAAQQISALARSLVTLSKQRSEAHEA